MSSRNFIFHIPLLYLMAVYAPNYTIDVREWTWVTRVVSRPDGGESYAGAREIRWSPLMRGGRGGAGERTLLKCV